MSHSPPDPCASHYELFGGESEQASHEARKGGSPIGEERVAAGVTAPSVETMDTGNGGAPPEEDGFPDVPPLPTRRLRLGLAC